MATLRKLGCQPALAETGGWVAAYWAKILGVCPFYKAVAAYGA
ncbi:MAG: hypothetical protein P4L47_02825 [Mucilaginibacter sp.]|nr:hypothetical protein [Mucilaginibacter sp.]